MCGLGLTSLVQWVGEACLGLGESNHSDLLHLYFHWNLPISGKPDFLSSICHRSAATPFIKPKPSLETCDPCH